MKPDCNPERAGRLSRFHWEFRPLSGYIPSAWIALDLMWCHCALGNPKTEIYWEEKVKSLATYGNPNACLQRLTLKHIFSQVLAQSPLGQWILQKVWLSRTQINYSHICPGERSHWLQGKLHELCALLTTLHEIQHIVQMLFLKSEIFQMNYNICSGKAYWWLSFFWK